MKTIALEEHFVTEGFLKATAGHRGTPEGNIADIQKKLLDLGEGRLAAMDAGGVDVQVLSLAALGVNELKATEQTAVLRDVNDELAERVRTHPQRFAAFCTPALKEPQQAAKELERCVQDHGFKGLLVDGTTDGKFLDASEFLPVWEAADALGVPVYLHPAPPPEKVREMYYTGLPGEMGHLLSIAGWGWHAETGLHILRLIVSGLLDRFPNLQIIIGHMGEGVPYAFARSTGILNSAAKHLKRSVADTFREQVHVTTSGYFTQPPFRCALEVLGIDRLMYSVDYPFSPNTRGQEFLAGVELSETDREKLAGGNAARLLKLELA
jgi:uncharacterized protein